MSRTLTLEEAGIPAGRPALGCPPPGPPCRCQTPDLCDLLGCAVVRANPPEWNPIVVDRAISLTQPWATLCAVGAKLRETRCWPTGYRGWIAIHAAKGFPRDCQELSACTPFRQALHDAGYRNTKELPRGQVIAVARLTECIATAQWTPPQDSDE